MLSITLKVTLLGAFIQHADSDEQLRDQSIVSFEDIARRKQQNFILRTVSKHEGINSLEFAV